MKNNQYLPADEAVRALKVSLDELKNLENQGKIKPLFSLTGEKRYKVEDINQLIKDQVSGNQERVSASTPAEGQAAGAEHLHILTTESSLQGQALQANGNGHVNGNGFWNEEKIKEVKGNLKEAKGELKENKGILKETKGELITVQETANLLSVSTKTIRRMISGGKLTPSGQGKYGKLLLSEAQVKEIGGIREIGDVGGISEQTTLTTLSPYRFIAATALSNTLLLSTLGLILFAAGALGILGRLGFLGQNIGTIPFLGGQNQTQATTGNPITQDEVTKLLSDYLSLDGGTLEGKVLFLKGARFGSNSLNIDPNGAIDTTEPITMNGSDLTLNGGGIYVGGVGVIGNDGRIPEITDTYFSSLDASSLTNVDAKKLSGLERADFLRSNESDTAEAAINFTALPGGNGVGGGPLYINPGNATSNYTLFGVAVNNQQKFKIDAEGDIYANGGLFPQTDNAQDLGSSTAQWKDLYLGGTINSASLNSGSLTLSGTNPIITFTDTSAGEDDWNVNVDGSSFYIKNTTDSSNYLSISGAGLATFSNDVTVNGTFTANGAITLGNGDDAVTINGTTFSTTQTSPVTFNVADAITDAWDLQEGTRNYINVNTTDGSEAIQLGNTSTNPVFTFLGSGTTTLGGDLAVNGATSADLTSATTTATIFNSTVTTLSIGSAATSLSLGAATGTATIANATVTLSNATTLTASSLTTFTGGATAIDFTEFDVAATTGSVTINDTGDAGALLIEGTNLDINSLDFVGAGTITSAASQGLALQTTSANLSLATVTSGNITLTTGAATGLANILTGNLKVGNGTPTVTLDGEDAYIEGTLEVDGTARFDGTVTFAAAAFDSLTVGGGYGSTGVTITSAGALSMDGDLIVGGTSTFSGNTFTSSNVTLGDAASDTITFTGVVNSNILPSASNTYNLGSSGTRWATGYFTTVDATTIVGVVAGGSTTSNSWTINSDNATANAEVDSLAFETGTNPINAVLQWNASGDATRYDSAGGNQNDVNLFNYPIGIYSQVSGGNQTFTSGSLFKYYQNVTHAITQSAAFLGTNLDFSSNITVPNSSSGNQTGSLITLKDGGASATAIGFQTAGTLDYGLDIGGTIGTAEIRLSNAETISNLVNGTVDIATTTLSLTGATTITGSSLTLITGGATAIDFTEFDVAAGTGTVTINDGGDAGALLVEGTNLDINSLDFVGAGLLTTAATTHLTFTPGSSGDLLFSTDADTVATFAGSAEGTTNIGLTAGDLLITDGDLTLSGGEIAATSDDATGTNFSFTTGALSTGTGVGIVSTSQVITSGGLLSAALTSSSATASFTGDIGTLSTSRTNATALQTLTDTGNILDLARTTITNHASATTNVTGPIVNIANTATQTLGTLSDSANLVVVTQDADATGALLHLVSNRSSTNYSLLIEQTSGGTDTLSLTDAGNLTILGDLAITGGNITTALTLDSTLTVTGTTTLNGIANIGDGGDAITLSGTTITLTANTSGNDITLNLTDNNADALDVQEGTNNYINVGTLDAGAAMAFGNATTNPTFGFLGTGLITIAGAGAETNSLTLTTGNVTLTDGDLTLSGGEISATSDDATGTNFSFTTGALSTGTGVGIASTSQVITSGGLLSGALTSSSATASFTGDIGTLSTSRTNATALQTLTDTGNILDLARTTITNHASATTNVTGPIVNITNTATQTLGTLTDSANLVVITQDADATGALLHLVSNRSSTNYSLLIEQTSGGTDTLSLTDAGNLTILGDLTVSGGDITGTGDESIDIGEAAANTINFFIDATAELRLTSSALIPFTGTTGLDLGSSTNQWADFYLAGGNVNFDNATDIDIDDNNASALTISESSNNYIALTTTNSSENITLSTARATGGDAISLTGASITTGNAVGITANALTTGTALAISSTSTAGGASGVSKLLDLSRSGANAQLAHTAYGIYSAVTNTNVTSGTNIAGYFSASGATTANYGLIVAAGSVGIGTTAPASILDISSANPIPRITWTNTANYGSLRFYETTTLKSGITTPGSAFATTARRNDLELFTSGGDITFSFDSGTSFPVVFESSGNVGIGDTGPDAFLEVLGTTEQLRLTHTDGTVDSRISVDSSGHLTIDGSSDGTGSQTLTLTGYSTLTASSLTLQSVAAAFTIAGTSYVRIGDTGTPGTATGDDALYVEGAFEVDGASTFDGTVTFNSTQTFNSDVDFVFAGNENATITNTTNTLGASGMLDLASTGSTTDTRTLDLSTTFTSTGATTSYGLYNAWTSSAVVTGVGVSQTAYGNYTTAAKTGADDATGTYSLYGTYSTASNTGSTAAGTKNAYGGYFSSTGDTAGTSNAYGLSVSALGADTNYGIAVAAMTGATSTGLDIGNMSGATLNTGINIGTLATATTSKGINIGAMSSATSTGIDLGAISGTTGIGFNTGALSATTSTGINIGNLSGTTDKGLVIGTLAGTSANTGIQVGAISGTGTGSVLTGGAITSTGTTNYGINLSTMTGGTTSNYQISTGAVTAIASATNAQLSLGGVTGTAASSTNYGINVGALSSTGTANYGLNIAAVSGATTNYALYSTSGTNYFGGVIYQNDTSNANMTLGATLNQGANDDEILALKSSDIGHSFTALMENDNFARFRKQDTGTTGGGLRIDAALEAGTQAFVLRGYYVTDDTTKSTSGTAAIELDALKFDGVSNGTVAGANANLLAIRSNTTTEWLVDAEGDVWQNGDIAVDGGDVTTAATTATLFNTTATTLSLGGAATTALNLGNGSGNYTAINLGSGAGTHTINIAGTGATAADTINIGTGGTGADTINIGSSASTTAINLTSGTGSQTFASSVATGSTTSSAFVFTANSLSSGTGLYLNSSGTITGTLAQMTANSLTTGTVLGLTATGITSGKFLDINNGSSIFSVSNTDFTTSLPTSFTSAGDVGIAYDINFTNPTASYIKSLASLYIVAGETFASQDLTLKTYNQGSIVLDSSVTTGVGINIPNTTVTTGDLIDITATALTSGYIMDITVPATKTSGAALHITDNSVTATSTDGLIQVDVAGATDANTLDIDISGGMAAGGSAIDITTSSTLSAGNLIDLNFGNIADTGDAINISFGAAAVAAQAMVVSTTAGIRTTSAFEIAENNTSGTVATFNIDGVSTRGGLFDIDWTGALITENLIDITYSSGVSTSNAIDLNMGTNVAGNAIDLATAATTGNAIDITTSGIFTNELIDINVGAQAATGDVINISLGATAVAAQALVIDSGGASSTDGWVLSGDNSGNGIWTGDMINLRSGTGDASGDMIDLTIEAAATDVQAFVISNAAASDQAGWLMKIDTSGIFTTNMFDIDLGAQASTGDIMNISMGSTNVAGGAFVIADAGGTRTDALIDITSASTATTDAGSIFQINGTGIMAGANVLDINVSGGSTSGNVIDVTTSGTLTASNLIDLNFGAIADTGDAINIAMGATAVGAQALVISSSAAQSADLVSITANSVTSGADIFSLSATGLTTGSALVLTGPTSTGVTDHFVKVTSDIGSGSSLANFTSDFSGAGVTGYGVYVAGTDATTASNTNYNLYSSLSLTGNAARNAYALYSNISTSSTTGDNTYAAYLTSSQTGVSSGTKNMWGLYSAPASTAAMTGTTNLYGGAFLPSATLATTSSTTNVYGVYTSNTGTVAAGTINSYGVYVANGTSDTTGTSTKYGLYVNRMSGADTASNFGAYIGGSTNAGTIGGTVDYQLFISADDDTSASALAIRQDNARNYGFDFKLNQADGVMYLDSVAVDTPTTLVAFDRANNRVGIGDTTPDALLDLDSTDTNGGDFLITNTGIGLSGSVAQITSNATTTGDIFTISSTALTTGTALTLTGPTSTGVTDHFVKVTSDIGSGAALVSLAPDFSGSAVAGYGLYNGGTDSTSAANTDYIYSGVLTLTGNAAKTGYVYHGSVTSSSTTADTIQGITLSTAVTGIITTGTRNVYGAVSQPSAGAESTGGTTNVYGYYAGVTADVGAGGTVNGYGLYVANGTFDTDGTSTQTGLYVESPTGADTNYAAIFAGGNVGISQATPVVKLDVGDNVGQSTTAGAGGLIRNATDADASPYTQARIIVYGGTGVDTSNWAYFGYGADAQLRQVYSRTASAASALWGTTTAMDGSGTFTQTMSLTGAGALTTASGITATTNGLTATAGGLTVTAGTTTLNGIANIGDGGDAITLNGTTVDIDATGALQINSSGGAIGIGNDAVAQAINIGTGAAARTITMGNATGATALAFNSGTGSQTFTSKVISGTTTTSGFVFDAGDITSGTGMYVTSDSLTSGKLVDILTTGTVTGTVTSITANSLTTGTVLGLTATGITSGKFLDINNGSSIFSVSNTDFTTSMPANFTAAGDVTIAYDINFTNPTASYIKSAAPLYVTAGETFNSSDLTLKTYNQGSIVLDSSITTGTGISIPNTTVTTGDLIDITATALTSGYMMDLTVPATKTSGAALHITDNSVTATSTDGLIQVDVAGATDANTLDIDISGGMAAGGSAIDITTSGTLSAGNLIDLNFGAVADTGDAINIALGATAVGSQALVITSGVMLRTTDLVSIIDSGTSSGDALEIQLSGATTGNGILLNNDAMVATGHVLYIDSDADRSSTSLFVIDDVADATASAPTIDINMTGATDQPIFNIDVTGGTAVGGNVINITTATTLSAGNMIDLNVGAVADTGDAINIAMGSSAPAYQALVVTGSSSTATGGVISLAVDTAAAQSSDIIDITSTLGIMDGSDVFQGIDINITGANHTGSNTITGIDLSLTTADAEATETALNISANWDTDINATTDLTMGIGGTKETILTSSAFSPDTTDSNALGTSSLFWSDLFLASGGVINYNSDVTLTHALDALTMAGGSFTVTGAEGSNQLVLTAGDFAVSDGSASIIDDDNAASFSVVNNTASTIGASAVSGVNVMSSTSLTTGNLLSLELTEGTLAGGYYLRAWDNTSSAAVFTIGEDGTLVITSSSGNTVTLSGTAAPAYAGTARPAKTISLNAEYPGAVVTKFYGAATDTNTTGSMTSDTETSATNSLRNYYQWERTTDSTQHFYTVAVRVKLPADFSAWQTSNALQIDYVTEGTTASEDDLDVYVYLESDSTTAVASSTALTLSTSWQTLAIDDSTLDDAAAPEWDAAGETAVIYLRMGSGNSKYTRVGDIKLNYLAAF